MQLEPPGTPHPAAPPRRTTKPRSAWTGPRPTIQAEAGEEEKVTSSVLGGDALQPQALTPAQAAGVLNVPYRTVMTLIHEGRLGHVMASRYYLVPVAEIQRFLADGINAPAAAEAPHLRATA